MPREQMTVGDLVKELQKHDPEAHVYVGDPNRGRAFELVSVDGGYDCPEDFPNFVVLTHDGVGEIPI